MKLEEFTYDGVAYGIPEKPVVDGYVFKDFRPAKKGEEKWSILSGFVVVAISDEEYPSWIATRKPESKRKVVRRKIEQDTFDRFYVDGYGLGHLASDPNFLGLYEYEDGTIHEKPVTFWYFEWMNYIHEPTIQQIESGAVKVRHAKYALFMEEESNG